jgi:MFS family permease
MSTARLDDRGFFQAMTGDGRPLLVFLALALLLSGLFAVFLGLTGQFLPHDERFLGMTAEQLCSRHACRIVHFMVHDRISFGGALVAIGLLYLWLAEFPLRQGQAWAWWAFLASGVFGFASFLAYLGYGYLDAWHGVATLFILPCFVVGVARSRAVLSRRVRIRSLFRPAVGVPWFSAHGLGRVCLLATATGMVGAGLTILVVGMTCVFVPQDLEFLGVSVPELHALNPRLVPLIAHDRAGFGGAVCSCGIALFVCVWCGTPSRALWQVLCLVGLVGFGTAIGVHPAIGYDDPVHLAPATCGAALYLAGLVLTYRPMINGRDAGRWDSRARTPWTIPEAGRVP